MSYNKELRIDWLNEIIVPAIDLFYSRPEDVDLICRDVSERAIVANIYFYMNFLFKTRQLICAPLRHLSIDIEYNRNFKSTKELYIKCVQLECNSNGCVVHTGNNCVECSKESCGVQGGGGKKIMSPDLLIHERNSNKDNQVAIEFKKASNTRARNNDCSKLTYLTCQKEYTGREDNNYQYGYGYFIDLDEDMYIITPYVDTLKRNLMKRKNGEWIDME
ncbi:MAG: hypothetical protein FWB85_05820 [Chitinispirillia bacterium]|nr:hypothetical protein [Chitinispirillia bacterium]